MSRLPSRRHWPRRPLPGFGRRRQRGDTRKPIGRDFSDSRIESKDRRWWAVALVVGVLTALAMVHVRVRLIEEGYQRAAAVERVEMLLARRQVLKAETGALRNRDRLTALARERGFEKPQREFWMAQFAEHRTTLRPMELRP
jgi:hypothetical protein